MLLRFHTMYAPAARPIATPMPGRIRLDPAMAPSPSPLAAMLAPRPAMNAMPALDIATMAPSPLPPSRRGLVPSACRSRALSWRSTC
jgi:hypothetical protein